MLEGPCLAVVSPGRAIGTAARNAQRTRHIPCAGFSPNCQMTDTSRPRGLDQVKTIHARGAVELVHPLRDGDAATRSQARASTPLYSKRETSQFPPRAPS